MGTLSIQAEKCSGRSADSLPPRTRRKPRRPRIEFPQFWEHRRIEYPLPEELPCGCCGAQRIIIRTHVTKRAEMEEAKLYVVEEVRYTYGCSHCHDGSQMQTTERPPQAVEKSPFGPSILAWLVTWKFLHHLPVYRQQELLLGPLKRWLSRALLCGLLSRTAQALRPLERLIHERVLASIVINADETEVKMLKPGNGKAITGYLSGYAGMRIIATCSTTSGPAAAATGRGNVGDYRGYLQTDGYMVYTSLVRHSAGRLVDVACWAHGRRGFEEAIPATSHPLVHEAMIWTQQLYDIEDRAKEMSADDRRALRQAEALPILTRMKARFDEVRPTLRPTAKLAEAIDYVLNRWDAFVRYTSDGRIPIDNNVIERLLRPSRYRSQELLVLRKREGRPDGGDALHAGAKCPAELRGRVAVLDRRAASDCGHRPWRHGCPGSPVAGSLGGCPSRAPAGAAGRRIPRSPGPTSPETGRPSGRHCLLNDGEPYYKYVFTNAF